jgi:alkanesulfonate monooxygenase SsuD/methylene tetrahydromethanopterin reductase-like flavin-dependent oxidoreductase (luciferase family)
MESIMGPVRLLDSEVLDNTLMDNKRPVKMQFGEIPLLKETCVQFGLTIPPFGELSDPRALASLASRAEEAGWDGFFIWDHLLYGPVPVADPWIALAAIALSTERVRIGPMVTPLPRRRPAKLAREVMSIDHLSRGRLILGVGTGAGPWEWEYLGEEPDPGARGAMLDEGLEVLAGLTSGQPFGHQGRYYTVDGELADGRRAAQFLRGTVQSPRVPIWVGGAWPHRRPFRRAARWDGAVPMKAGGGILSADEIRAIAAYIATHRTSSDPFEIVMAGETPGDEQAAGVEIVAPYADAGLTWWLENIHPWRFGWQWTGPWPVADMEARIRQGPPYSDTLQPRVNTR